MKMRRLFLALKYWLQGDSWQSAKEYADAIVCGFKRIE